MKPKFSTLTKSFECQRKRSPLEARRGFALVSTLALMVLLSLLAVGLLSLSSVELRTSSTFGAKARAEANARLALMLAIAELQKHAGDDRRITADASITGTSAKQPNLVGVWESWSPDFAANPTQSAPNYETEKASRFKGWLAPKGGAVSPESPGYANQEPGTDWVSLFTESMDGFSLRSPLVEVTDGGYSWAISQEGTKAKINVAGPELAQQDPHGTNAALQAQPRPSVALSENLTQPTSGWNRRAASVVSLHQVGLDTALASAPLPATTRASYTTHSSGLLTDVVKGGLKVDMSLGFELSDAQFAASSWGSVKNPFRSGAEGLNFSIPNAYKGQRPLFKPLQDDAIVRYRYGSFDYAGKYQASRFLVAGAPTFDHLRSFGRLSYHLYGTTATAAARWEDHIAAGAKNLAGNDFLVSEPPPGQSSTLSVLPVLDRSVLLFRAKLDAEDRIVLLLTPVVVLWNPYNIPLEIGGMTAYNYGDFPYQFAIEGKGPKRLSTQLGNGRQTTPFIQCQITENGDNNVSTPIRFEPGELRVFAPNSGIVNAVPNQISNIKLPLKGVKNANELFAESGVLVDPADAAAYNHFKINPESNVNMRLITNWAYPYNFVLEDGARFSNNPVGAGGGGRSISVVDTEKMTQVTGLSYVPGFLSKTAWKEFAVAETLHHVTTTSLPDHPVADLVYTSNPRHSSINPVLLRTTGSSSHAYSPHYRTHIRSVSSFDGIFQTTTDGRNAYWGPSWSAGDGKAFLPFFEIPRQPLLSLAAFHQADLSNSSFSSSFAFANSFAFPYLSPARVGIGNATPGGAPVYDNSYLTNEALWDGFFFSGMASVLEPGNANMATAWNSPSAQTVVSLNKVIEDFIESPLENSLPNPRMRLEARGFNKAELLQRLTDPEGCTLAASHLSVDGAFNVNSTDAEAWTALLSGLRGQSFQVDGSSSAPGSSTAFPRGRHPTGDENDVFNGFRSLSDSQIRSLAENLANEVKKRGPFLSLAEFVNRRVDSDELGRMGAIQAAIDATNVNSGVPQKALPTNLFPSDAYINNKTGVGLPGYLTQADVLQSLAPVITPRSDTFTIRAYGEAKDTSGNVVSRAWCEAVVQRRPDFVDPSDEAETPVSNLNLTNQKFGRRFEIVAFRNVHPSEFN